MSKVAIVEDDTAIAQMYQIKFEAEGYEVQVAENGKLGLELLENMRPDIVLLDLMMPEMNGDQVLTEIRKTEWGKNLKVIILTNMGEQEAPEILKQLNVSAFIVKADMTPKQVAELVKSKLSDSDPEADTTPVVTYNSTEATSAPESPDSTDQSPAAPVESPPLG